MSAKKKFLETAKRQLDAWKDEVEQLQMNADRVDSRQMRRYSAAIQDIIARIQRIEKRFAASADSSQGTWEALKRRVNTSDGDIDERIKRVKDRFSL